MSSADPARHLVRRSDMYGEIMQTTPDLVDVSFHSAKAIRNAAKGRGWRRALSLRDDNAVGGYTP